MQRAEAAAVKAVQCTLRTEVDRWDKSPAVIFGLIQKNLFKCNSGAFKLLGFQAAGLSSSRPFVEIYLQSSTKYVMILIYSYER